MGYSKEKATFKRLRCYHVSLTNFPLYFQVSFAGCIGALRENMCLLKFYSLCLLLFFLAEMALAALGFLLPHKVTGFLEGTLSDELISNYRDDLDFQNFIDLLQTDFDCCGISSAGYKDWSKNVYFNCTINEEDNPSPERCGVPYSCCLPSARFAISGEDMLPNTMCGYQVQLLPERNVTTRINTRGCVPIIRNYVEGNLYTVAGIALGVALAQLLVIWLSRTLEGQKSTCAVEIFFRPSLKLLLPKMNNPFFKICDSVKSSMEQEATEINPAFKNYFVLKNCEFNTVKN